ncbi:Imm1 family immunity protein [Paracoccus contaminans]|uniref:Uncharacterized protein n=1 Tax=Paracoccus contaminans TaxID=1945662 RepID=A0A1W6CUN9_9RHOB|nr:Imm1 family immunity protein [Paracoccus contaminans]ARJ68583.1 hypothetical protein B0A89_01920 [Paracoccus contaminans]
MQAFIETFDGTTVETDAREIGSESDAQAAVDALDGRMVTSASFERGEGAVLLVSGGPGAYLASLWNDETGEGVSAEEPGDSDGREVEVISAGQSVVVPARRILSRARVGEVVASYVAGQDRSTAVEWAED